MSPTDSLPVRLRRRIAVEGECWRWTGVVDRGGYGQVFHQGRMTVAHRVVYVALIGAIPAGLELDHLCRNTACVNPAHLEPVDHATNVRRGVSIVAQHAVATHCAQGHAFSTANTTVRENGWRRCLECKRAAGRKRAALPETKARQREADRRYRQRKKDAV